MTTMTQIATGQVDKETLINELLSAVSPAGAFGQDSDTTTGLTWGYYGGIVDVNGTLTAISNGTLSLSASTTNYIEMSMAGVVSVNTIGYSATATPIATIATTGSAISTYTDHRRYVDRLAFGFLSFSVAGGTDTTLTAAQSHANELEFTGALTGNKSVIFPLRRGAWHVYNNTSGDYTLTMKASSGTGILLPRYARSIIICDGTNFINATSISGIWTPTATFATVGDLGVSYTTQVGRYEIRGRTAYVSCEIAFTPTFTTAAGELRIAGLPFLAENYGALTVRDLNANIAWPAGLTSVSVGCAAGVSYFTLRGHGTGAASAAFTTAELATGTAKLLRFYGEVPIQ